MNLISHRGNLTGSRNQENNPFYIIDALKADYQCEIDLWSFAGKHFLGHDKPIYEIEWKWISKKWQNLLIHCKTPQALECCVLYNSLGQAEKLHYFWHENDRYTVTNFGRPVCFPGQVPLRGSIYIHPEQCTTKGLEECWAIVSDYVQLYKKEK